VGSTVRRCCPQRQPLLPKASWRSRPPPARATRGWIASGQALRGLVGAIGWSSASPSVRRGGSGRPGALGRPFLLSNSRPLGGAGTWRFGLRSGLLAPYKLVIWLILPVVICLSQRLSHACLSISNLYCETANGSLNQLSFI
jgi:hypothetical protein